MADIEINNFVQDQYQPVEIEIEMPNINRCDLELNSKEFEEAEDLFNQLSEDEENMGKVEVKEIEEEKGDEGGGVHRLKKSKKMELDSGEDEKVIEREYEEHSANENVNRENINEKQGQSGHKNKSHKKRKDKQIRKLEKKLKKDKKKQKKEKKLRKEKKLKKMRDLDNENKSEKSNKNDWSGEEDSDEMAEDSDSSSDSLLENLNPRKKLMTHGSNAKSQKQFSTEKKEGFSLKELGNDAEVDSGNNSGSESYSDNEKTKKKGKLLKDKREPKKEITKNQNILQSLLAIGLCVEEDESKSNKGDFDNGLEEVYNMKGKKNKGPKIVNKLFMDMDIKGEEKQEEVPKEMELEIRPRISSGPSSMTSSFLSKTEKWRKVRGMESQMHNEEYEKLISSKAKESITRLISQKEVEEAEEIELDVKVPEIVRGRGEINNSIFLKGISTDFDQLEKSASAKKSKIMDTKKIKIGRLELFKSMTEEAKSRKSREVTHEAIKNSFKITRLEEIEDMRKKNEEKRRREALRGSDDESDEDLDEKEEEGEVIENGEVYENKLKFMNFKVELENNQEKENNQDQNKNDPKQDENVSEVKITENAMENEKSEKGFDIFLNKITDEEYKELIELEGENEEEDEKVCDEDIIEQESDNAGNNNKDNDEMEAEDENELDIEIESSQNNKQIVDEKGSNQEQFEEEEENELADSSDERDDQDEQNDGQEMNEEYQEYLQELEDEGINIKKTKNRKGYENISDEKENERSQNVSGLGEEEARREFRKLRKIATILKSKRKIQEKINRAGEFYEEEAEEGSDNEENDGLVKNIDYAGEEKEYEGLDLDADLEELIDNAVDINEQDEEEAFRKYMEDAKIQEREELKRIMRGDFKRRGAGGEGYIEEIEEDEKERLRRMEEIQEYMKQKEQEEGKDLYLQDLNQEQEEDEDESDLSSNARRLKEEEKKKKDAGEPEQLDDLNEENLKRYFDDCLIDHRQKVTSTNTKPLNLYPESYKREKNTLMRNTMKPKESGDAILPKMKKNTSHLNVMIMKNKQPLKPLAFMKKFNIIGKK